MLHGLLLRDLFAGIAPGTITTIAGVGYRADIPAKEADAGWPHGVVRLPNGDVVVADSIAHRLWLIDAEGNLHIFAGDGVPGNSGDGGPATQARVFMPHDLFVDRDGNVYVAQTGDYGQTYRHNTIRRIDHETGVITRVAGSGEAGRGGDGGPALEAEFDITCGVAVDADGNLYACGKSHNNVRRVDVRTGTIEPFAGDPDNKQGFKGDGGPALEAALNGPEHLAFDSEGSLYICDNDNNRVRKVDKKTGAISTVFGTGEASSNGDGGPAIEAGTNQPDAMCIDAHDNLYVGEVRGFRVRKVDARTGIVQTLVGTGVPGWGEEGLPGLQTRCNAIEAGIWADPDGTVLWGDSSGRLRRYDGGTGVVTTVFGGTSIHDGGPATAAFLTLPGGISLDPGGSIFIADTKGQRIRAIEADSGIIRTVAGNGARCYGGDGGPAAEAYLGNPSDVSVDRRGRVAFVDGLSGRVRRVDEYGIVDTVAGTGELTDRGIGGPARSVCFLSLRSLEHAPNGDIYVGDGVGRISLIDETTGTVNAIAGDGVRAYTGDGGPAAHARIGIPSAIAVDEDGNLYFTDGQYHVVRRIDTSGVITTLAGTGERGCSPNGTPAIASRLDRPQGIAVCSDGTLAFSDTNNNRVCRVSAAGKLETIAGSSVPGDTGDGGPATRAGLNRPTALRFYGPNVLLISDSLNNRIKAVRLV